MDYPGYTTTLMEDNILSPEILSYIERLSAAAFTLKEICIVLELDEQQVNRWMRDQSSQFYKANMKGKLETQLLLRERIFKDAGNGSSPAQTLAIKIIETSDIKSKMKS